MQSKIKMALLLLFSVTSSSVTSSYIQAETAQIATKTASADALRQQVEAAEAKVNERVTKLRGKRAEPGKHVNDEVLTKPLLEETRRLFDLQMKLQLAELAEAEAKIAESRRIIARRQQRSDEIVSDRVQGLLNVPEHAESPQAVLAAMERFTAAADYEGLMSLLSEDEADRMAGMLLQSMSTMNAMFALMDASSEAFEDAEQIRSVIASGKRFMRPNPPPAAVAAWQQISSILPSMFYEMGATSNGQPLQRPKLTAEQYSELLRQASGVLSDKRAFSASMMKAAEAIDATPAGETIPAEWQIKIEGTRAVATQLARPLDRTTNKLATVELVVDGGLWKISKMGSDEEMMEVFSGSNVTANAPSTASIPMSSGQGDPSAAPSNSSMLPTAVPYVPGDAQASIIRERMQGRWIVESFTDGSQDLPADKNEAWEINIEDNVLEHMIGTESASGPILLSNTKDRSSLPLGDAGPLPIDFTYLPNGEAETHQGIIACNGETLSICMAIKASKSDSDFRPKLFVPGSKVALWKCRRASEKLSDANGDPTPETKAEAPPGWNEFLELLPESGTTLVVFDDGSENAKQMLPVARSVAKIAAIQFIQLPHAKWRKVITPSAIHFVLMKDRGVVATRTGLLTEKRLKEFVALASDWLTPHSTGVDENSLVRIDCFINPGRNNIGSQHGGVYPLSTVVAAVDEDRALLLGPESIAGYIEKGYACVALVRDASGKRAQVPLDVVQIGQVPLQGRTLDEESMARWKSLGYIPDSRKEPQDAYDTGMAVYEIRDAHGLKPVRLKEAKYVSQVNGQVLSVGFRRERHVPPLHNITSRLEWQSQLVKDVDASVYGGNLNGPHTMTVLCPTRPAPTGFTFADDGRLIGKHALGSPSDEDMTHRVHQPYTIHSVLHAALPKMNNLGLKGSLAEQLGETKTTVSSK